MSMAATQKPLTGWHVLAMLVAFFGVIIGVNLTMAYFANSTWSGLVVANGYVASQSFDKDLARARAQRRWAGPSASSTGRTTSASPLPTRPRRDLGPRHHRQAGAPGDRQAGPDPHLRA